MESVIQSSLEKKERLWTFNFFLLWQGQLVSALGDVIYQIALGFWVLAVTGSTMMMGTLMAVSTLPRIIISPFAGVIVDRADRKWIMVWMDFIRGVFIVGIGAAALLGILEIWMVFAAGVVLGICAAFFNPAVSSATPDIVPSSRLTQANSYFSMIHAGSNILGSSMGGILYQIIGAPILFLFNGISYLFSAATEVFIKVPKTEKQGQKYNFWTDMKEGLGFIWRFKSLRDVIFIAGFLNFFANMGIVLILPLFQRTVSLGAAKYGVAIAFMTAGSLVGMIFTSVYNIKPNQRAKIFLSCGIISSVCFSAFVFMDIYYLMLTLLFIAGALNAILNVLFSSVVQLTVPQDKRGKVFSIMGTVLGGLMPFAMLLGGFLGEFLPLKLVISGGFMATTIIFLPFIFMEGFKRFINYDPASQTMEEII